MTREEIHAQQKRWVAASYLIDPRPAVRHDVYIIRDKRGRP